MTLYLNPTTRDTSLGDDHLWLWLKRSFDASYFENTLSETDILLNSSFHRLKNYNAAIINVHLELMKELRDKYHLNHYSRNVEDILHNCKESKLTTIPSKLLYNNYKEYCKNLVVVPIGVDTNVFKPLDNKQELRDKYKLPKNKRIGFWSGNDGVWRGVNDLKKFINQNSDVYWIINYYRGAKLDFPGSTFFRISQPQINELLAASDFYLCTNQIGPYYMSDWEAISANVPIIDTLGIERELGLNPSRAKLLSASWGRDSVLQTWKHIIYDNHL